MSNTSVTLKRLRSRLLLTQAEFAKKIGCSLTSYNYWENGKKRPHCTKISKIISIAEKHKINISSNDFLDD